MSDVTEHFVTREAIEYIVNHMRARDREEIFALRWTDDDAELVRDLTACAGKLWRVWSYQGEPVAINGALPVRPGVVAAAGFGTDKWRQVIRPMTAWAQQWLIPCLQTAGYHRGEAYVSAANMQSRRWLDALGAQKEAYLFQYGRNCEDFILYVWRLNDVSVRQRQWRSKWRTEAIDDRSADRGRVFG